MRFPRVGFAARTVMAVLVVVGIILGAATLNARESWRSKREAYRARAEDATSPVLRAYYAAKAAECDRMLRF